MTELKDGAIISGLSICLVAISSALGFSDIASVFGSLVGTLCFYHRIFHGSKP